MPWRILQRFLIACVFASSTSIAFAQDIAPWHASGWSMRAVVRVNGAGGTQGVDTAAVRIVHAGAATANGNDLRVFNDAGQPVPYQLAAHIPGRESLISFRCPPADTAKTFYVYYGNPGASIDPLRTIDPPIDVLGAGAPKPGPAANGWTPRTGLVLTTLRRPRPPVDEKTDTIRTDNPNSPAEMSSMIKRSPKIDGVGYRRNISDGINPFGDSDLYISVYRGWMNIPATAKYGFCTASNEASFSFLDGKDLVHWPGRHTEDRGRFGEKSAEGDFSAGLHYVEYYQEEVLLYQMSFLGYKPPGTKAYIAIPDNFYPQPYPGTVERYEIANGQPTVTINVAMVDSLWPRGKDDGQYTRFSFTADPGRMGSAKDWSVKWSFGDGLIAEGTTAEHVYFSLGNYTVTMTATGSGGQRVERQWPLSVYQVDHIIGGFRAGSYGSMLPTIRAYDKAQLKSNVLAEMARFLGEAGDVVGAQATAAAAITRPDLAVEDQADMHLLIATASNLGVSGLSGGSRDPAAAKKLVGHLKAALDAEKDPAQRMRIRARFIRAVGIDQTDLEGAVALYTQAEEEYKQSPTIRAVRIAFKDATIAIGDARLYARKIDEANFDYRTAEALSDTPIPPQVRASKSGAFPETIEQAIKRNQLDAAMTVAERWQRELPSDQIRGAVLFYIGKLEQMRGRPAASVRLLQLAIDLAQGAEFEAEARWYLALAYRDLSDNDAWKRTLAGLVKSGLPGEFRKKAIDALTAANASSPASPQGGAK